MTVSPGWPQDGNGPPKAANSGVDCDDIARPALPPTLFQLPNLKQPSSSVSPNPVPPAPASIDTADVEVPLAEKSPAETIGSEHSVVSENTEPVAGATAIVSSPATSAHTEPHPHEQSERPLEQSSAVHSTRPIEQAATPNPAAAPAYRTTGDQPAGRSWMESIGSHGVVIVLLLVVVAAALVTGRHRQDSDVESSLAEHSDLLEIDEGQRVDLPIPDHGAEFASSFAASNTASPEAKSGAKAAVDYAPYDMMDMTADNLSESSDQAVVSLDVPRLDTRSSADAAVQTGESQVRTNQFVAMQDRVDVMAASSRNPSDSDPSLPSLEDLSEDPSFELVAADHRLSKTPAEMKNLLQYLPPKPDVAVDSESDSQAVPDSVTTPVDEAIPTYSE